MKYRILNRCPNCDSLLELREKKEKIAMYCLECKTKVGMMGSKTWNRRVRRYNGEIIEQKKATVKDLKYMPYDKYINSKHWKRRRLEYYKTHKKICFCCEEESYILHHCCYDNRGEEKDEDLVPVCTPCHERIHNELLQEEGVWLKNAHEVLKSLINIGELN